MADLGYPEYKPDLWVRAFVLSLDDVCVPLSADLDCDIDELPSGLIDPNREYMRPVIYDRMDALLDDFTEPLPGVVNLDTWFRRLRAADFIIAHFGIGAERLFGLRTEPLSVLLRSPQIAEKYPELAVLAQRIDGFQETSGPSPDTLRNAILALPRRQPLKEGCTRCGVVGQCPND
jgi:hypothetical protein